MFQIEKNIPAPLGRGQARRAQAGRNGIYPFESMEVGDSFVAPRDMGMHKYGGCARQNSILASARGWAKRHAPETRFSVYIIDKSTVRCWRVK